MDRQRTTLMTPATFPFEPLMSDFRKSPSDWENQPHDSDERLALLALLESGVGVQLIVGRLDKTIKKGALVAIEFDSQKRPTLRKATDREIGIQPWHGSKENDSMPAAVFDTIIDAFYRKASQSLDDIKLRLDANRSVPKSADALTALNELVEDGWLSVDSAGAYTLRD